MLTPDTIAAIAKRLAEHVGLELPAWVIDARAMARIAALGCTPDEYVALIESGRGAGELVELVEAVRVGESRLFRHRPQIDVLAGVIAPALRARGQRAIRVWSAGCAAGEEPYTLAMVLSRALPDCAISIRATDVSAEALARAAAARYPRAALDHVPERYRDCFVDDGEQVRVTAEIAALVDFERANLLDGVAPRSCDVVWCRNVLIYFTADARRRVIDRLVSATVPGGFVFVGYSESLRDVAELDGARAGDTVYYVRRAGETAARSRPPTPPVPLAIPADKRSTLVLAPDDRRSAPMLTSDDRRSAPVLASDDRRSAPVLTSDDRRSAPVLATSDRGSAPVPAPSGSPVPLVSHASEDRTPPPRAASVPTVPLAAPADDTLALRGHPAAAFVTAEILARLAMPGLHSLVVDVDGADMLGDELGPVLRRARAAARTAGIALSVRATRAGARRWLARHGLDEEGA